MGIGNFQMVSDVACHVHLVRADVLRLEILELHSLEWQDSYGQSNTWRFSVGLGRSIMIRPPMWTAHDKKRFNSTRTNCELAVGKQETWRTQRRGDLPPPLHPSLNITHLLNSLSVSDISHAIASDLTWTSHANAQHYHFLQNKTDLCFLDNVNQQSQQ